VRIDWNSRESIERLKEKRMLFEPVFGKLKTGTGVNMITPAFWYVKKLLQDSSIIVLQENLA